MPTSDGSAPPLVPARVEEAAEARAARASSCASRARSAAARSSAARCRSRMTRSASALLAASASRRSCSCACASRRLRSRSAASERSFFSRRARPASRLARNPRPLAWMAVALFWSASPRRSSSRGRTPAFKNILVRPMAWSLATRPRALARDSAPVRSRVRVSGGCLETTTVYRCTKSGKVRASGYADRASWMACMRPEVASWDSTSFSSKAWGACRPLGRKHLTKLTSDWLMVPRSCASERVNWSATPEKRELPPKPRARVDRWKEALRTAELPPLSCPVFLVVRSVAGGALLVSSSTGVKSVATKVL
mmetsp:Transcript_23093/g.77505  ORF Transcript_23093/g.77505 Transcript_23093/m.77505 type:complete len:310 (+) Transcript_23093:1068-1997(+)